MRTIILGTRPSSSVCPSPHVCTRIRTHPSDPHIRRGAVGRRWLANPNWATSVPTANILLHTTAVHALAADAVVRVATHTFSTNTSYPTAVPTSFSQ